MELTSTLTRRCYLPVIDSANLRVAQLDSSSFFVGVRAFPPERWSALGAFAPNVLAGSAGQLQRLLERVNLQTVEIDAVDHSVFVVTQLGDTPLSSRLRDRLWRQFAVPIYELYLDEYSRLLAFECEAQEGWHVAKGIIFTAAYGELLFERGNQVVRTGLNWQLEEAGCPCGRPGPRLLAPGSKSAIEPVLAISA